MEGSGRGLICRNYSGICLERLRKITKRSVRIACFRAEIWTRHIPNAKQEWIPTFRRNTLQSWRWRQYVPPNQLYLPTIPPDITNQKTNISIFTAVRTSDLIKCKQNSNTKISLASFRKPRCTQDQHNLSSKILHHTSLERRSCCKHRLQS
jgi:hypothetical protein